MSRLCSRVSSQVLGGTPLWSKLIRFETIIFQLRLFYTSSVDHQRETISLFSVIRPGFDATQNQRAPFFYMKHKVRDH